MDASNLPIVMSRDLDLLAPATGAARRGLNRGEIVRLRRGAYMPAGDWAALDKDQRYLSLVCATAAGFRSDRVLSHESAAAVWGLPIIGPWPPDVHVLVERASGGRSDPGVRRHALGIDPADVTTHQGLLVTTPARTVVDLAATARLYSAVVTADAAIHRARFGLPPLVAKQDLYEQWERMNPFRGFARARRIIEFADELSGSPSEGTSRTSIALLGFPEPELQREYVVDGERVWVDFYFAEIDGIAECDGAEKYLDPRLRKGLTAAEVVLLEKRREDALRRQCSAFTRWNSREAMSLGVLRSRLLEIGLRPGRPRLRGR